MRARVTRDMRQAYYAWMAVRESVDILLATAELAQENLRVNESLHRNGKVTRDLVLRAEADLLEVEQGLAQARAQDDRARRYVNLLRNRPLDTVLVAAIVTARSTPVGDARSAAGAQGHSLGRAELRQIDAGLAAADAAEQWRRPHSARSWAWRWMPARRARPGITSDSEAYVMASLVLRFNLFNGGADRAGVREARARTRELQATRALAEQQIRIEVQTALTDFQVAEASLRTASRRQAAAADAFTIVSRKRDLGQVSPAEFLDARRSLTEPRGSTSTSPISRP